MAESIVVEHASKRFTFRHTKTFKQHVIEKLRGRKDLSDTFLAVDDVSFTVQEGEAVGLMGLNGSGKSTLLKLISGVMHPDSGRVLTRGRIAGLLELGAGFHPQLTGRENIYLNGAILGMSEAEINKKLDSIISFANLGKFIDTEVGRYSSGMFSRLGFAVSVHTESEIFLIDEVLAVGDPPFRKKCLRRIDALRDEGRTIVFVSHSTNQVKRLCSRAIVLEQGRKGFEGSVEDAVHYLHYDEDEDQQGGAEVPSDVVDDTPVEVADF